jgi:hypothetical protein
VVDIELWLGLVGSEGLFMLSQCEDRGASRGGASCKQVRGTAVMGRCEGEE